MDKMHKSLPHHCSDLMFIVAQCTILTTYWFPKISKNHALENGTLFHWRHIMCQSLKTCKRLSAEPADWARTHVGGRHRSTLLSGSCPPCHIPPVVTSDRFLQNSEWHHIIMSSSILLSSSISLLSKALNIFHVTITAHNRQCYQRQSCSVSFPKLWNAVSNNTMRMKEGEALHAHPWNVSHDARHQGLWLLQLQETRGHRHGSESDQHNIMYFFRGEHL